MKEKTKIAGNDKKQTAPQYGMWSNTVFMLLKAWGCAKSVIVLCLLEAGLAVAANLVRLYVTPTVLNAVETAAPLGVLIRLILLFTAALITVDALSAYLKQNALYGRVTVRSGLSSEIHDKLCLTSYPNTEKQDFLKRLDKAYTSVGSNSQATEAIWSTLTDLLQNIAGFVIYLALLSSLDPILAAVTALTAITGYLAGKRINGWEYRHREEAAEYSQKMRYIDSQAGNYSAAKDIRLFGMKPWITDLYNGVLKLYREYRLRAEKVYILADIIDLVLAFVRNGIAYAYLIAMTLKLDLGASQFLLYFTAVGGFSAWIGGILSGLTTLHRQSLDISTVREYLESDEEFQFEGGKALKPDPAQPYEIELKNVSFCYPGAERDTLKGINLLIRNGEKLAVVGLNGAGKTTLIKLICGFLNPTEGCVLLNGRDVRELNRRDYYLHFAAVFQQFSLLAASVASNVAQRKEGYDLERVKSCIEKAGLTKKIETLPDGYLTMLGKEVYEDAPELSGGELQRLMLARALYKNAPIVILDEPTAALDPIAESDLYQKYSNLTGGRTSVYISHRLASTRFCDRIVLIEDGKIAEEGTHGELLLKGGHYAGLYEIQSRYYRKEEENEQRQEK